MPEYIQKQRTHSKRDVAAPEIQQPGGGPDDLTVEILGSVAITIANINDALGESSDPTAA